MKTVNESIPTVLTLIIARPYGRMSIECPYSGKTKDGKFQALMDCR